MAQLELSVVLNLANFRTQLGKLAQASAAYYYPVNLTIDKQAFKKQLAALGNIKPVIKIDDSQLDAARARIGTLNKSLATLRKATSTPIEIKLKYVEVGKPPSAAAGQIGSAVSGRVRADQAVAALNQKQLIAARNMLKEADVPVSGLGKSRSLEAYRKSIVDGMANAGKESIAGLAQGLKNGQSAIGQAAKLVGKEGIRAIKDTLGIASPSRVFKQIGEFSVDGLELGFLNGLKDFKSKSVAEVKAIVALLKFELAKVSDVSGMGGPSMGSLRRQLVGQRAYTSPIGPQPIGSRTPWAAGSAGQFGSSGYEPRMVSRPYTGSPNFLSAGPMLVGGPSAINQGQYGDATPYRTRVSALGGYAPGVRSSAFFPMSGMMGPSTPNPSYVPRNSFLGFSQRATQVTQSAQSSRGGGGSLPPGGFPVDDAMVTRGAKLNAVMDLATASTQNFRASQIPLIGGIKNLAGEFGEATKQVLLYGTAYKGLAFLTSLPGQVLNAAKSQQQFNNGLKVATQETGTFAKELLYVDNVQRAFGLNLETTRTGFTRLYASMGPTGFDSGSIEKLFTGISAATAALQLTPDKAERVIYAFGQMASKGQIMSEELKGQLGDVLPGALAIFSKAAGMSVKEFSKAMEDGEFVGTRFREVFAKVSDELMNRFGTGAQVAGRSLQGLINTVGGDFQRTLESFAPLANAAAQATLGPLTGMLREVSMAAQIAMGEQDRVRKQLEAAQSDVSTLKAGGADAKEIKAAETNVAALAAKYEVLNEAARDPAISQQVKNIEAFVIEIQKAATFTMNLAGIIGSVLSPLFTLLGGNLTSVIGNLALLVIGFNAAKLAALVFAGVITAMRSIAGVSAAGAAGASVLAAAMRLVGVQATAAQVATIGFGVAIKGLLISTGVGALVVLLGSLAAAFLSVGDKAKEAADKAKRSIDSMADAARTGNVSLIEMDLAVNKADRQDLESFIKSIDQLKTRKGARGIELITLTPEQKREAGRLGLTVGKEVSKGILMDSLSALRAPLKQVETEGRRNLGVAKQRAEKLGLNKPTPGVTSPETPEEDPKAKAAREKAEKDAQKLANQNQQRAIDLAALNNNLDKSRFDGLSSLMEQDFEYAKRFIEEKNKFELFGLNDIEARQKKFQQELQDIQLKRIKAVGDAERDIAKAELDFTAAQNTAAAANTQAPPAPMLPPRTGGSTSPRVGSSFQGFQVTSAPGESRAYRNGIHEGYDIATPIGTALSYAIGGVVKSINKAGRGNAGKTLEVILDNGIIGMSMHLSEVLIEAGQRFTAGQLLAKTGDTGAGPAHLHQESAARAYKSGQAGASLAYLNLGRGNATLGSGVGRSKAAPGSIFSMERRQVKAGTGLEVESQDRQYKIAQARLAIQQSTVLALKENANVIAANKEQLFPVAQLQLENKLRAMRNQLLLQGMPEQYIAYQEELGKKTFESNIAIANYTEENKKLAAAIKPLQDLQSKGATLLPSQSELIKVNTGLIKQNEDAITGLTEAQKAYNIAALESAIASIKNADALKAQQDAIQLIDGNVESATGSYKNFVKEVARGGDPAEALKKFQDSLTDQVLTVFLDYAFKPVEDFFKESLRNMFGLPSEEKQRQETLAKLEAQLAKQERIAVATERTADNTAPGAAGGQGQSAGLSSAIKGIGLSSGIDTSAAGLGGPAAAGFDAASIFGNPEVLKESFAGIQSSISESMNGIVSSFESGATSLATTLPSWSDALTVKLPATLTQSTEKVKGKTPSFQESLGKVAQGIGIAATTIMGVAAGISQIKKKGTSNVLMGIGSILASIGGGIGGFTKLFAADGGVAAGGWKPLPLTAFANGGMVSGPTLGLIGEGKYNEAIVPLPNGRSIPVEMTGAGGGSLRDAMGQAPGQNTSPILNMSFQSTTINGVEYVSRDQLEQAMAQTRREASRDGAQRGMTMTLDKLQQSPTTRRRVGI